MSTTKFYAIIHNRTGELFSSNGKHFWENEGRAKGAWTNSNLPLRWSTDGVTHWSIKEVKVVPVDERRKPFEEWVEEKTAYGSRFNWIKDEIGVSNQDQLRKWLHVAYETGFKQGEL